MKTDFVTSAPRYNQTSNGKPSFKELTATVGLLFCVVFTVLFVLSFIYDTAKHFH